MGRLIPAIAVLSVALFALAGAALGQTTESPVEVTLTEFTIEMPGTLPAGPTTFEVTNAGTVEHNFEIEGQGIEEVFETNLQPGETRTMQVDLEPGTYEVYCPVDGHREQGMELTLTVDAAAQVTPTTAAVTPTATAVVTPAAAAQVTPTATVTPGAPAALPVTGGDGGGFSLPLSLVLLALGVLFVVGAFALRPRLR